MFGFKKEVDIKDIQIVLDNLKLMPDNIYRYKTYDELVRYINHIFSRTKDTYDCFIVLMMFDFYIRKNKTIIKTLNKKGYPLCDVSSLNYSKIELLDPLDVKPCYIITNNWYSCVSIFGDFGEKNELRFNSKRFVYKGIKLDGLDSFDYKISKQGKELCSLFSNVKDIRFIENNTGLSMHKTLDGIEFYPYDYYNNNKNHLDKNECLCEFLWDYTEEINFFTAVKCFIYKEIFNEMTNFILVLAVAIMPRYNQKMVANHFYISKK